MSQVNPTGEKDDLDIKEEEKKESASSGTFKFNAAAPEFVPRSHAPTQVPITGYFYPSIQYTDGSGGNWIYVSDREAIPHLVAPNPNVKDGSGQSHHHSKDVLSDELKQKIIKQVEYQFSDMSMLANEALVKQVNKDSEGFVPIAVVASTKKLKSLNISHQLVAQALRSSSKLIVSNDSKKLRTVVAENLPDDHSHQNIEKIFNVVGSVKTIRICQPQEPNSSRSKSDFVISHKLHALIEYEKTETAERAAEKLNDERNWRKGLRVRCLLRRSPKSVLKNRKSEFDGYLDDDEGPVLELHEDSSRQTTSGSVEVEYQFSDMSMLANEALVKQVNKDSEGFVPIAVVASTKKLKSLNISHQLVAQALRSSSKLIVSNDSKKVKRKKPFTDKDREELQLRTVVAENLPDDHSHQNIEKIFNVVGSVKTIRICQPQEPNSSRSKSDFVISHKLHALIEYEKTETAERAAEKLNDERNWRKGLRVRCLLRRSPRSVLKNRKSEFDGYLDDDEGPVLELHEDSSRQTTSGSVEIEETSIGSKQTWGRGRGKSRQRIQLHSTRSLPTPSSHSGSSILGEVSSRHTTKGPGMPDGTRGFTMGRGKPISVPV